MYLVYCIAKKRKHAGWPLEILKVNLSYFLWACYNPIMECMITAHLCDSNNKHVIDKSVTCFSGIHIFVVILSLLFLILAVALAVLTSVLYHKTQPVAEDALALYCLSSHSLASTVPCSSR